MTFSILLLIIVLTMKVKVSSKGQIVIPKKIREDLKIKDKDSLYLTEENGQIVLEKVPGLDSFFGSIKTKRAAPEEEQKAIEDGYIESYLKSIEGLDYLQPDKNDSN